MGGQDFSPGADLGSVVDDLTASGTNGRTPIREKLMLRLLDDFVEVIELIESLIPGETLQFCKRDFLRAFRHIPGDKHS